MGDGANEKDARESALAQVEDLLETPMVVVPAVRILRVARAVRVRIRPPREGRGPG